MKGDRGTSNMLHVDSQDSCHEGAQRKLCSLMKHEQDQKSLIVSNHFVINSMERVF